MSAGDPQASCRKATDITELLLQVYLVAWTMREAKDGERSEGRTSGARPAFSADPWFDRSVDIVPKRGRRERRRARRPEQPARVGEPHRMCGSRLTRGGRAATSPLDGTVTRRRDLHRPGRRVDERRVCRRTPVFATGAQLTTAKRACFASPAARRRVWPAASRFVSYSLSRPYLAGSATNIREEAYVGS